MKERGVISLDYTGLFIIPVLTAILTTITLHFKDKSHERYQIDRKLKEQMLIELYNKLYILKIRHYESLTIQYTDEVYDISENDIEMTREVPHIDDDSLWVSVMKETTDIIYEKIHLLDYNDLLRWYEYEKNLQKDIETMDDIFDKYYLFKSFLKESARTYGNLYHEYHLKTNRMIKSKKKSISKRIKTYRNNPFLTNEERKLRINNLKKQLKELSRKPS